MEKLILDDSESLKFFIKYRDELIEDLNILLKDNINDTEGKSVYLLQKIFKFNSNIKILEDSIFIKRMSEKYTDDNNFDVTGVLTQIFNKNCAIAMLITLSEIKK